MRVVDTTSEASGRAVLHSKWLVAQRFDVTTPEVLRQLERDSQKVVPVIGLAFPLASPLASPLEAAREAARCIDGVAFCFLPMEGLQTHLPVHLNACFCVHDNRRGLWLPDPTLGEEGDSHVQMASWNAALLCHALPRLWVDVIVQLRTDGTLSADAMHTLLPDLGTVGAAWQPCATAVYELLRHCPVLPHTADPLAAPVAPADSLSFEAPTFAFELQRVLLQELYDDFDEGCAASCPRSPVVFLPAHVQSAMAKHSGLRIVSISDFLLALLARKDARGGPWLLPSRLAPCLLALTELVDGLAASVVAEWRSRLGQRSWVPLLNGGHAMPSRAFAPGQTHLREAELWVVERSRADLSCDGVIAARFEPY